MFIVVRLTATCVCDCECVYVPYNGLALPWIPMIEGTQHFTESPEYLKLYRHCPIPKINSKIHFLRNHFTK